MPLLSVICDIFHGDNVDDDGFHKIKASGIQAVIHKASQGLSADSAYAERKKRALSVGLKWGSYHFGVGGDASAQADRFLQIVNPMEDELLVLDWETNDQGITMPRVKAEAFVQHIHDELRVWPVLYSGMSFLFENLDISPEETVLSNCPVWVARYSIKPPTVPAVWPDGWKMWQYTDGSAGPLPHTVRGIGPCDRSKFNGTQEEFDAFWNSKAEGEE